MKTVGSGVRELRARDRNNQYRTMYVIRMGTKIVVLHSFIKKSRTTPKADIETAKQRLRAFDRNGVSVMKTKVTKGNVFKDLGFTDEESVALAMRVDLAVEIEKFIRRKKLTQMKAAEYFDVPQPKISKIVGGKVSGFSLEYLVKMATKAGKNPRISFAKRQAV